MSNFIYAIFDEEDVLMKSIKPLKTNKVRIKEVFSPYPIHGLDHELGIKDTRISIACFLYGMTGCFLAILMVWYMMISDWPINIGGKPNFNLYKNIPAFIPVIFESTVLCAAHGMVITFYLRSKILPGVTALVPDVRMTDDHFVMQVEIKEHDQVDAVIGQLKSHGATEVKTII